MARASVVTFHVMPVPTRGVVTVMVTETGQPGGEFWISADARERVRRCFTPGPGVRVWDYPP
jgi:hypothetical protein